MAKKKSKEHSTIAEIAEALGITERTIHHYRSIGILKPSNRISSGVCVFSPEDIDKLKLIVKLKDLDIPLKEISLVTGNYPVSDTGRDRVAPDFLETLDGCIQKIDKKITGIFTLRRDIIEYRLRIKDHISAKGQPQDRKR